ncbi:glycoside hydrolase superfamily [Coniella lustricola]|uniref:Glycoside hydrolase superfamily n=1 Tax=Coniella lustricola TaxID=2025994 RepID=A0A2T2ZSA8_9PEZI|nr:glycoside hydrolase superfamily [Coniella lustricola]
MTNLAILSCLFGLSTAASWPNGPFTTSGSSILDASGNSIKYAGANWPGAADVMIPEGLQYQSVASIVAKLTEAGVNVIRLTYAIELIDQIYENDGVDVPISTAFVEALGEANGTAVFKEVLAANPSFSANITRLEVFDAIAEECAAHEIYVHLDNHISTGTWCCSTDDGNAWWGDEDFSIANWTRGISYMADHVSPTTHPPIPSAVDHHN